jgi:hypothetical protein
MPLMLIRKTKIILFETPRDLERLSKPNSPFSKAGNDAIAAKKWCPRDIDLQRRQ